jgi:hypothetical protein
LKSVNTGEKRKNVNVRYNTIQIHILLVFKYIHLTILVNLVFYTVVVSMKYCIFLSWFHYCKILYNLLSIVVCFKYVMLTVLYDGANGRIYCIVYDKFDIPWYFLYPLWIS